MLILRNATVVDAEGVTDGDVTVEDGTVVDVGDATADAPELDVDGSFVVPGLVDAHVHLMMDGRADSASLASETEPALAYQAARNLADLLDAGVTTVRDLGAPGTLALDAGRAVERGVLDGPRVLAAGENVVMTGGHGHWFGREADGRAEIRTAVREQLKKGADVVKCMATGGVLTEGAHIGGTELDEEELRTLVATAAAKGRPTAAHAHAAAGIKNATRAGISSVEHGTYMDREAAQLMAERGTYWVPTASALAGIVEHGVDAGIPEWAVEKAEAAEREFASSFEYALDEGVPIAMGTDAGTPFNFHGDVPRELALMVEYGLSPEAALEAATVNAADLLGLDDVGLVRPGYAADLVVLPADPREDAAAWGRAEHVVKGGELVR